MYFNNGGRDVRMDRHMLCHALPCYAGTSDTQGMQFILFSAARHYDAENAYLCRRERQNHERPICETARWQVHDNALLER